MEATYQTYIGIDIGGTNSKVAVLSEIRIEGIQIDTQTEIVLHKKKYHLFTYSSFSNQEFYQKLVEIKKTVKDNVKIVGTGGGTVLKLKHLQQIFEQSIHSISEFNAQSFGLQFYKTAGLLSVVESFSKNGKQIKIDKKQTDLQQFSDVLFMSLGSGVNFQLYGDSGKGFERKPAKDKALAAGDEFFLEGTCLGAGFLMGLSRLKTEEQDFTILLKRMKKEEDLKIYYDAVIINLFSMAVNMSLLHEKENLVISGALLSYDVNISDLFVKALLYVHSRQTIKLNVIRLQKLEGFLGVLGALECAIAQTI